MKYVLTKKQVKDMYDFIVDNYNKYSKDERQIKLVLYRKNQKIDWIITLNDNYKNILEDIVFEMELENFGIFEWVILKEIGGRKKYTKQEIVNGIQWNLNKQIKQTF